MPVVAVATLTVLGALSPLFAGASTAMAQSIGTGASSSVAYLDVLRTRSDVEQAAAELARADALLRHSMLSPSEHEGRRAAYVRARLAYLSAVLAAAGARTHLGIVRAVKSRTADGRLRVVLTVRNESAPVRIPDVAATSSDREATEVDTAELAALSTLRGAVLALKTDAGSSGAVVSRPYEQTLRTVGSGESRQVTFDLLEDLTDVVVAIDTDGRIEERRIRLETDAAPSTIAVQATQFSLEGDLGSQVLYDLRLQRARPSAVPTRLSVRGLPAELSLEFRDPDSHTRLGQIRFPDGATSARVQLAVSLPGRPSAAARPDAPLAFAVVATDEPTEGRAGASGETQLELVPRGVARLELRPASLALQATTGTITALPVLVRNAGTGRVDDLRLRVEAPPRWQVAFEPAAIIALAPGDDRRVSLHIQPPADADGGDYELRVGVDDASAARRIEVEDKLVRVRVAANGSLSGAVAAVLAVVALGVAGLVYGRRWVTR